MGALQCELRPKTGANAEQAAEDARQHAEQQVPAQLPQLRMSSGCRRGWCWATVALPAAQGGTPMH